MKSHIPPRHLYGNYLVDIRNMALEKANHKNIDVNLLEEEVIDIRAGTDDKELLMKDGKVFKTHYVIMSVGNFPPNILQELKGTAGYIPYPWPVQEIMNSVPPTVPVGILGTGLSAIDTLFTLLENGHRENIYFISRTGFIPKVQGKPNEHTLQFIKKDIFGEKGPSLDQGGELFVREIEAAEGEKIDWLHVLNPRKSVKEILEEDIAEAKAGSIPNQSVLLATAGIIGDIWNKLSPQEKRRFDCYYKSIWTVFRHPMPIINAEKVLAALKSGQLKVLSGFKCIRYLGKGRGFHIDVLTRYGVIYHLNVHSFINASGQGLDVMKYEDKLLHNLINQGTITPHPNGGIYVDFDRGFTIDKDGKPSSWLFAVGEMTRGVHFFTNAISQIVIFVDHLTNYVLNRINNP